MDKSIVQCILMDDKSNGSDYCPFFTLLDVNKRDFFFFFSPSSHIVKPVYPCFRMVSKAPIKYQQWCLSRNIDPVTKNKTQTVSSYSNTTVLPHRRNYTLTKDERLRFVFWRCMNTLPWLGRGVSFSVPHIFLNYFKQGPKNPLLSSPRHVRNLSCWFKIVPRGCCLCSAHPLVTSNVLLYNTNCSTQSILIEPKANKATTRNPSFNALCHRRLFFAALQNGGRTIEWAS